VRRHSAHIVIAVLAASWLASTLAARPAAPPVELPALAEVSASENWKFSTDEGQTWSSRPPTVRGGHKAVIVARTTFDIAKPDRCPYWTLDHALYPKMRMSFRLNDQPLPLPLAGMRYRIVTAIPAEALRRGRNVLTARITIDRRPPRWDRRRVMKPFTIPLPRRARFLVPRLRFQTGPILGAFGPDYWTVTCRLNLPGQVKLIYTLQPASAAPPRPLRRRRPADEPTPAPAQPAGPQKVHTASSTKPGLYHRFRVPRPPRPCLVSYRLEATFGTQRAATANYTFILPYLPPTDKPGPTMRFIVFGDSRTNTHDWARVASAVLKERPQFLVFLGDLCGSGRNDWEWDEHFLGPEAARKLLATTPLYLVWGNHEGNSPLARKLFYNPGGDGTSKDWAQQIGPVLLVGIDGRPKHRWRDPRWIENALARSKAPFIIFCSHYPAYSSGPNGRLKPDGRPEDSGYRIARRAVVPRLLKHKATAFLAAHEHCYERSELPGGLSHLILAGAGAPRCVRSEDATRQNPYSKVFAPTLHYGLFVIRADRCDFLAKTPEGLIIDRRSWQARKTE